MKSQPAVAVTRLQASALPRGSECFPSSDREAHGVIVDDFGESIGIPVEIGGNLIAGPARRWAVMLDDDNLLFVDSEDLEAE